MNGIELLDKIKNNFETSHIPVVLLTAKSSVESKIEGLKYGADAYMIKPFHSKQLKAQLENLLHQRVVLRNYYVKQVIEPIFKTGLNITERDAAFLEKVREVIDKRLSDTDLKIEDLYKSTGMGRSKFFGKLKGLTGISPIDFIKEYRLNKAFALFQSEDFNVSEVAYQTGYNDAGYFSKCFKERFGINPSEMIKERKDKENLPADLSE
jgi:AraC-like DNA-binding protein